MDLMFLTFDLVSIVFVVQQIFSIEEFNIREMKAQLVAIAWFLVALQVN